MSCAAGRTRPPSTMSPWTPGQTRPRTPPSRSARHAPAPASPRPARPSAPTAASGVVHHHLRDRDLRRPLGQSVDVEHPGGQDPIVGALATIARRWRDARGGAAALEFALVLPVLVTFILGIWYVG